MGNFRLLLILFAAFALTLPIAGVPGQVRFVDDRFEEFRAGELGAAGQNLYVSRDGKLRTINSFDLNQDGHLDLVFNCTHDTYQMISASVGTVSPQGTETTQKLAVEGSKKVALGDLNRDGWTDAVFCPNEIGVDHTRRHVWIAWGGKDGWSSRRIHGALPVHGAVTVALPDLNADGWPDIAVLSGERWRPEQPAGKIVRVFWGSKGGYSVTEFTDLGVPGAIDLVASKPAQPRDQSAGTGRGASGAGLAVLCAGARLALFRPTGSIRDRPAVPDEFGLPGQDGTCICAADGGTGPQTLFVGTAGARVYRVRPATSPPSVASLDAFPASHLSAGDLDGDGEMDLALTQFGQARAAGGEQAGAGKAAVDLVRVLWGRAGGGFEPGQAAGLKVASAAATAIADLNGDRKNDLVVAVHQGARTFAGRSVVYYGQGGRALERGKEGFETSGTTDVAVAPAEQGLAARAVFCNSIGGHLEEAVPVPVYWGGPSGFDPRRVLNIPLHSGYEASAADLNADGYPDLVLLDSGHAGESAAHDPMLGANIIWGGPKGPDPSRRTVLRESFLGTSTIADLNRDGYLDLVLEPFGPEKEGEKDQLILYFGAKTGFSRQRRVTREKDGYGQEHLVADLNRDRRLDIAVTTRKFHTLRMFFQDAEGGFTSREQSLFVSGPVGIDAADFDRDGNLDLLVGSYNDPVSNFRDMGSTLFWGGGSGYSQANSKWVPGYATLGRTAADFDGDGWLDLFSPQQSGELTREDLACHFYWGGPDGFHRANRTTVFADSVNDSMAGDFNGDGRIDLAVACHTRHGDHRALSRVFYNDGNRFRSPRTQYLPTNGPHLMYATDVGNLYDRKYREHFTSRVFSWQDVRTRATVKDTADTPPGAELGFQVRSAPTRGGLLSKRWIPARARTAIPIMPEDRCLQYRALLGSRNGARYPVVDRVEIELTAAER